MYLYSEWSGTTNDAQFGAGWLLWAFRFLHFSLLLFVSVQFTLLIFFPVPTSLDCAMFMLVEGCICIRFPWIKLPRGWTHDGEGVVHAGRETIASGNFSPFTSADRDLLYDPLSDSWETLWEIAIVSLRKVYCCMFSSSTDNQRDVAILRCGFVVIFSKRDVGKKYSWVVVSWSSFTLLTTMCSRHL